MKSEIQKAHKEVSYPTVYDSVQTVWQCRIYDSQGIVCALHKHYMQN